MEAVLPLWGRQGPPERMEGMEGLEAVEWRVLEGLVSWGLGGV